MNIKQVNYPTPGTMVPRTLDKITDAIIHHSAGNLNQTPIEIDQEHRARGMAMIGYNFVILPLGDVYAGRPLNYVPAAAYGRNAESVNICLTGNFEKGDPGFTGPPTDPQVKSLQDLLVYLHHQLPTIVRTIGHYQVASLFYPGNEGDYSTACPGSELIAQLGALRSAVSKQLTAL